MFAAPSLILSCASPEPRSWPWFKDGRRQDVRRPAVRRKTPIRVYWLWELEWMQNFQVMNSVKFDITKFKVLLRPVLSLKACYLTLTWRYLVVKQCQYVSVSYLLVPETPTTATIVELRHWFLSLARCETRDNEPVPDLRPRLVWGEIAFRPSAAATIAGPCRISPLPIAAGGTDCPNSGSCHSGTRSGSHGGTGHSCSATADTNHGATRDADIF